MSNNNGGGAARTATATIREKVEFPLNEPVILQLDYNEGRLTQGRGGDQYQCTFNGGTHIAWFDPDVHEQIVRSGAGKGDEIAITRRQQRGSDRKMYNVWEVQKVEEEPSQPEQRKPQASAREPGDEYDRAREIVRQHEANKAATRSAAAREFPEDAVTRDSIAAQQPPPSQAAAAAPRSQRNAPNTEGVARVARTFADALTAADMSIALAKAEGVAVNFKPEDVRAIAITMYIHQGGGR